MDLKTIIIRLICFAGLGYELGVQVATLSSKEKLAMHHGIAVIGVIILAILLLAR